MLKSKRYINEFREEALEHLANIEMNLLGLEKNTESPDPNQVHGVFRGIHSIKGAAGFLGLDKIQELTHIMETLLSMIRSKDLRPDQECIDALLSGVDLLKNMAQTPDESGQTDISRELNRLKQVIMNHLSPEIGEEMETEVALYDGTGEYIGFEIDEYKLKTIPSTMSLYILKFDLKKQEERVEESPMSLIRRLVRAGEIIEGNLDAPLDDLHQDITNIPLLYEILYATFMDFDMIAQETGLESDCIIRVMPEQLLHQKKASRPEKPQTPAVSDTAKQEGGVEASNAKTGDAQPAPGAQDSDFPAKSADHGSHGDEEAQAASIRVPEEKMDQLVDLVGELLTVHAGLALEAKTQGNRKLHSLAESMGRLTNDLRDITLGLRMTPIESVFGKFERFVRDLSRAKEKRIIMKAGGGETELDKKMIERISDPLSHIIRNSIDHGIETVAERKARGKPEYGTIHLSASQSGGNVLIAITDDGGGLDTEKIRAQAEKRGRVNPGADLSDSEIHALIFEPGFSTTDTVTEISGRGVGMDVVKQAVESLRGTVDIKSRKGLGTSITLSIPMTLAIIDGLLVQIADAYFVFPLFVVQECVALEGQALKRARERNMMELRGRTATYINLKTYFGIRGNIPDIERVVIARAGDEFIGFGVDRVVGEHKTVIKSLGKVYRDIKGISGGTVMGDGAVALILDVNQIYAGLN